MQRSSEDSQRLRRTGEGVSFCVFGFSVVERSADGSVGQYVGDEERVALG
jgi:hypothetical protein